MVKTLSALECPEEAMKVGRSIEKMLYDELGISCVIGVSTDARHLRELADRYKMNITLTVSLDAEELPEALKKYI